MTIEGYFAEAAIKAAIDCGAIVEKLEYHSIKLTFPTQSEYDWWFNKWQSNELWNITITPKAR